MVAFEEVEVDVDMPPFTRAPATTVEEAERPEDAIEAIVCIEAESSAGEARSDLAE